MSYVGWPTRVNKLVLDATQVTVGEGAVKEETLENGKKRSRLLLSAAPKKFSVVMRFNYSEKGTDGLSEAERFWHWYERVLRYSVNEFQFPDLMHGIDSERLCWYRITGAVQGAKSGLDQEIQMTWESSYDGIIEAGEQEPSPSRLEVEDGAAVMYFSGIPSVSPTTSSFGALIVDGTQVPLTTMKYFNGDRCYLYFDRLSDSSEHEAHFSLYPELTDHFFAEA